MLIAGYTSASTGYWTQVSNGNSLTYGQWHYVVYAKNASESVYYLDGQMIYANTVTDNAVVNSYSIIIGGNSADISFDALKIFNYAQNASYVLNQYAQYFPVANFIFSPQYPQIIAGDTVNFTDESFGGVGPYSYSWDFGDGFSLNTARNPTHLYVNASTYEVSLDIFDQMENFSSYSVYVYVLPAPLNAMFTQNATNIQMGDWVRFTDLSTGGYLPYTYNWSFGDGYNSSLMNPLHKFNVSGSFTVNLTIQDSSFNVNSSKIQIVVNIPMNYYPIATINTPNNTVIVKSLVQFYGGGYNGKTPYTFQWNFGDGEIGVGSNPTHMYTVIGIYNVSVILTDANGNNAIAWTIISVVNPSGTTNSSQNSSTNSNQNPFPSIPGFPFETFTFMIALGMVLVIWRVRIKWVHERNA